MEKIVIATHLGTANKLDVFAADFDLSYNKWSEFLLPPLRP